MKWRKRKVSVIILLMYPTILFVLLTGYMTVSPKDERAEISEVQSEQYIVPYLKGQGLNNQLWEYRTAAIYHAATSTLEPSLLSISSL